MQKQSLDNEPMIVRITEHAKLNQYLRLLLSGCSACDIPQATTVFGDSQPLTSIKQVEQRIEIST